MKSNPPRAAWKRSSTAERTVTLLGATGSIGASTVDLLKRERKRFRVEAVCANKSAAALAALARELGARFAAFGCGERRLEAGSAGNGTDHPLRRSLGRFDQTAFEGNAGVRRRSVHA